MSDLAKLVVSARSGDADAYAAIVRRFQDMAVGYGYWLLRDLQLAEDAAQEAFLEAYLCLPDLREPAAFAGWFRRIVIKQCDRMTRGKKVVLDPLDNATKHLSTLPDQVKKLEQSELRDQIWSAIDSLAEHERAVVILFHISGHSQHEVSEFLDVPVTSIKKRLFSARGRLREMLMDVVADNLRDQRPSRDDSFSSTVVEMLNAARTGDVRRVGQLFKHNHRLLTARDWLGNTALIMAVNSGQEAVAELLFKAGVQPDIHEASAIGRTERVARLLVEDATRLDSFSDQGFTPVGLAAHFGHLETTAYLLGEGANANIVSRHPLQVTPLHAALFGRQLETARLLIERGADVNARRGGVGWPRAGWTALHYAAGYGMIDLIEPLLAAKADINALDEEGKSPLLVSIESNQCHTADVLRQNGATELKSSK